MMDEIAEESATALQAVKLLAKYLADPSSKARTMHTSANPDFRNCSVG